MGAWGALMPPHQESCLILYVDIDREEKSKDHGQGGTQGATASGVGATARRRAARREGGGEKTRKKCERTSETAWTLQSVCASASGARSVEAAWSKS